MASKNFILFASDNVWHAGAGDSLIEIPAAAGGATPGQIASAAAEALKKLGHGASPITLAIPSNWCLCATIRTDDLPKSDYKSLLYRLEEKLPWPAESITADFIRHEDSALGVCIKTDKLRPLIDALESHGIPIQTITPTTLLAAANQQNAMLLIESTDHVDLLAVRDGKPIAWSLASKAESDVSLQLNFLSLDVAEDLPQVKLQDLQRLALKGIPLINLRQHDLAAADTLRLHRRALNAMLAAAAMFLIAIAGVFLLRSHQYQQQGQRSSDQLKAAFASHFPAWEVPANIKAVIESEHRRLITSPSTDLPPEAAASAVPVLYSLLLANLPADTSINVQHLTANADSLDLEAQLKSYEDADAIAAAARKAGLEVPPPQVRKENNNLWSLTLHATKIKPVAAAK